MSEELVEPQKDAILVHHPHSEEDLQPHEGAEIEYHIPANLLDTVENAVLEHAPPVDEGNPPEEEFPQYELPAYRWQQNGRKISKITDKNEVIRRQHWRCSNWDKPNKEKGCKAKYRIDIYSNGKPASEPFKNDIPHNHLPPPERGRVDMETQLQMAVNPSKREKGRNTPSKRAREEEEEQTAPKDDFDQQVVAIQSVIRLFESYGDHFVRKVDLYPEIRAIFASPKGLEDLIKHQHEPLFISADYIALGLTLIIFSVMDNAVESAVLWLITNARDANNYELMLRYVHDLAEHKYKPTSAYTGADLAFREAFTRVFPGCNVQQQGDASSSSSSLVNAPPVLSLPPAHPQPDLATTIMSSMERQGGDV